MTSLSNYTWLFYHTIPNGTWLRCQTIKWVFSQMMRDGDMVLVDCGCEVVMALHITVYYPRKDLIIVVVVVNIIFDYWSRWKFWHVLAQCASYIAFFYDFWFDKLYPKAHSSLVGGLLQWSLAKLGQCLPISHHPTVFSTTLSIVRRPPSSIRSDVLGSDYARYPSLDSLYTQMMDLLASELRHAGLIEKSCSAREARTAVRAIENWTLLYCREVFSLELYPFLTFFHHSFPASA